MRTFVFLHVLTMFAAVAVTGGGDLLFYRIARTRDAAAIRGAGAAYGRLARIIPVQFLLGDRVPHGREAVLVTSPPSRGRCW